MSIRDYKITDEQFNEKGMTSLPDTLNGTPYENKKSLEKFTREVVAPQFNAIVEVFAQMEDSTHNWSAEEAQRVQRENGRQAAEQGRADAESTRAQSEKTRLSAESQRVVNENARSTAETARANAENGRASAESARVTAENARNAWEEYSDVKTYAPGNKVSFGGSSYVCTAATVGHEPTDTAYWLLIAQKGMDGAGADDLRQINNALDAIDPTKVTTKATPADGDGVMIADSADGGKAKRLLWSSVKTALGKLFVPLARKVNGKTLAKDVTLTGDDIAMGADDAESLRTATAKRPLAKETLTLAGDINAKSAFPYGKSLVFRTTNSDWGGNMPSDYAAYAKLRSSLSGSYDMWFCLSANRFWFSRVGDDVVPALSDWRELARCVAPEVHALPLTEGWDTFGGTCCYYKTQENVVTVSIRAKHSTSFTGTSRELICNLPAGFRPSDWVSSTCALDIGDSGGSYHGGIHIDATGGVYINGFATYATVYAQISFVAAS